MGKQDSRKPESRKVQDVTVNKDGSIQLSREARNRSWAADYQGILQKISQRKEINGPERTRLLQLEAVFARQPDDEVIAGTGLTFEDPGKGVQNIREKKKRRLEVAAKLLTYGWARHRVARFIAIHWKITIRSGDRYVAEARDLACQKDSKLKPFQRAVQAERLETLFSMAIEQNNIKAATQVCAEIAKLHGLYAPTKIKMPPVGDVGKNRDQEEIRQTIVKLIIPDNGRDRPD